MEKYIYLFSELDHAKAVAERNGVVVEELMGGKGTRLAEMTRLGLPVPQGFTMTTRAYAACTTNGGHLPKDLWEQIVLALETLEGTTGKRFGDPGRPLLVSCRSGARHSMPGMMDTILNIGLNDVVVANLALSDTGPFFAYDLYRRFLHMFGATVLGIPDNAFREVQVRLPTIARTDGGVEADECRALGAAYKDVVREYYIAGFPTDPYEQLRMATETVFRSWNSRRAVDYRNASGLPHHLGTAATVQIMVFGNLSSRSGSGVCMSRNGATGEATIEGDYLNNAQGEDVVAGIRSTEPIQVLKDRAPEVFKELLSVTKTLEGYYRDMQDIEFTIENGKLWLLQTRTGTRSAVAALRIAVDMANEGLITREEAVRRVPPDQLDPNTLCLMLDPCAQELLEALALGLAASPGAAVGQVIFDADTAVAVAREGRPVILVRPDTSPDDLHGMLAAEGILTSRGGRTSHAALVARQFRKPAVVGVSDMEIDLAGRLFTIGDKVIREGDWVSLDGTRGIIYEGALQTVGGDQDDPRRSSLLSWAKETRSWCTGRAGDQR